LAALGRNTCPHIHTQQQRENEFQQGKKETHNMAGRTWYASRQLFSFGPVTLSPFGIEKKNAHRAIQLTSQRANAKIRKKKKKGKKKKTSRQHDPMTTGGVCFRFPTWKGQLFCRGGSSECFSPHLPKRSNDQK
jgi:hypothetical protein